MTRPATQDWVHALPIMQQSVLIAAVRGPDGIRKEHVAKNLLRWFRRCVLIAAFEHRVFTTPYEQGGGSFTGPSLGRSHVPQIDEYWEGGMTHLVGEYLRSVDELPHHFQLHFMHAAEIVGYKHPDLRIRAWWQKTYCRLVHDMHVWPETESELDKRLGDTFEGWAERNEEASAAA